MGPVMCWPIAGSTANCEAMASLAVAYEMPWDVTAASGVPMKHHVTFWLHCLCLLNAMD